MPIIDPSTFHGYTDSLQPYLDGVKSLGAEKVGDEECDKIEVSIMKHQRSWYLWLSKTRSSSAEAERNRAGELRSHHERRVVVGDLQRRDSRHACSPGSRPRAGRSGRCPRPEERLLKPGTKAPDFELASADGKRIKLSDYRGQVVWFYIWRAG